MSRLPHIHSDPSDAAVAELLRRVGDIERVLQEIEGSVSPFDGSTQDGMFASASIGRNDIAAGQISGEHILLLGVAGVLSSAGTTLQGDTLFDSGAAALLASGVSQPITAPGVALVAGGSLDPNQNHYVAYTWYDGSHETTPCAPPVKIKTTATSLSLSVTLPPAPVGATQARIYLSESTFGAGGGQLQTAVAVSTSAPTTVTVSAYNSLGAGSPSVSSTGFASSTATLNPAAPVDSTGAPYGWTLEGNGRARFLGPTINDQFWLYDDFYYPVGSYPGTGAATIFGSFTTVTAGTAATVVQGTSLNTDPGVVQIGTGTTTTGKAGVRTGSAFGFGVARLRFSAKFMFDTAPNGTNSYYIILGITSQGASGTGAGHFGAGDEGVVFQFIDDVTSQLVLVTGDGSSSTRSGGVAVTAGNWIFAEWEIDAGLTGVDWWVNGVKKPRITTSLPRALAAVRGVYLGVEKTATGAGIASRTLNVDTVSLFGDYVSG